MTHKYIIHGDIMGDMVDQFMAERKAENAANLARANELVKMSHDKLYKLVWSNKKYTKTDLQALWAWLSNAADCIDQMLGNNEKK